MESRESKFTFFRQSGWVALATMLGGAFMVAVHKPASKMPEAEYGVFLALLQVFNLMSIPAIGLQTVFARQTAAALDSDSRQKLVGTTRAVIKTIFVLWLVMLLVVAFFQQSILHTLQITHPAALWITVMIGLLSMWSPVNMGLLQGQQNFLWYGGISILGGVCRLAAVFVFVYLLQGGSSSAMIAVLAGVTIPLAVAFWQNRFCWTEPSQPIVWKDWLEQVIPLTMGAGAASFMMSADMVFVQKYFDKSETAYYGAAGMIGRSLMFLAAPVAAVMFPKIVKSAARAEKSNILFLALGFTALMCGGGALFCTFFPTLPLKIVLSAQYIKAGPLIPWFVWCILPLTLANILVNNLLAKKQYHICPWLVVIALGYGMALDWCAATVDKSDFLHGFSQVIKVIGGGGLLWLIVAILFTIKENFKSKTQAS